MSGDDLVALVQGQEQLRRVASSYDGFADEPGLVSALAQSGATTSQIQSVGGFLRGMQLTSRVQLARESGVQIDLNDLDRAALAAIGTQFSDVDRQLIAAQSAAAQQPTHRSFWGQVGHIVNNATQLPVVKQIFHGLDRAADIVHMPFRAISSIGADNPFGLVVNPFTGGVHTNDQAARGLGELADTANAQGGGNGLLDNLAFLSHGNQVFHPLDDLRQQYSPEQVDLARQYVISPENFVAANLSDDELAKRQTLLQDPRFQNLVTAVDARHISPGRDLAGAVFAPGSKPYKLTSGTLDAAYSFFADPTIIAGKLNAAAKLAQYGIKDLSDVSRIEALMRGNNAVRRGWQGMLDDAKTMREGDAAEAAAAYARRRALTPDLVPMLDEINGGGLRNGRVIDNYDDLVDHVTGTGALLRMRNGLAAREAPLMPGALSRYGYRQVRGILAGAAAARGVRVLDLTNDADKFIPKAVDALNSLGVDVTGLDEAALKSAATGQAVLAFRRSIKGRLSMTGNRLTTLLPEHERIDLTGASGIEDVRRFAALYMPRAHANMLAARYSVAPVGERRAILEGVYDQVIHASGIPSSVSGRAWYEAQKEQRALLDNSAYDASGNNLDRIAGTVGEPERRAALYEGQTSTEFHLPSFVDLRRMAAKVSLYDYTMRSAMEGSRVDRALTTLRTSWLLSPSSSLRNGVENVVSAHFRGASFDEQARARAALSSATAAAVADRAVDLASREVDSQFRKMANSLRGVYHGRILSGLKNAESVIGERVSGIKMSSLADHLVDDGMAGDLNELLAISGQATRGAGGSLDDAVTALNRGFKISKVRFRSAGYQLAAADGMGGARYWSRELARRFGGSEGQPVLRAALDGTPLATPVRHSVSTMRAWAAAQGHTLPKQGLGKKLRQKFAAAHPDVDARQALVDHLLSDEYKTARAKLERFATLRDGTKVGDDPAMIRRAAEELADDQIVDMRSLITGRNGEIHPELVDHLRRSGTPNVEFLNGLPEDARPEKVIQPHYVPDLDGPAGHVSNVVQALADKAYNVAVAKPLAWMSTLPIYHANYVKAYDRVRDTVAKLNPDLDEEALTQHTRDVARMHAMDLTVQMIDNPRVRSQFSLITRNVFNFWRAQEDFLRRWGRNLKENPAALRELQLAVEGGMHTGIVHTDDQGNLIFSYPGSGRAIQALGSTLAAFGLGKSLGLGVVPNMTTKLQFLNSGLDRPFLPTTSPVASLPLRILKHFSGDQVGLIQAQALAEGDVESNRSWWAQFLPAPVYRFMAAQTADDREGQYASSVRNAMLNLYAAGLTPQGHTDQATGEYVPPHPDEQDAFKKRVETGVRNHLTARAMLALILPGAPSSPTEESDASNAGKLEKAAYNTTTLKTEFQAWVSEYGYQRALALWTKTHPDDLAYTVSSTEGAGGTGGYLGPTEQVLGWMQDNQALTQQFPSLAAFFAPDGPGGFSQDAWRAELELGLRRHKNLDTFYRDIVTKNAETVYYKMRDLRDQKVAEALGNGDTDEATRLKASFSDWVAEYKAVNPLLTEKWQQGDQNKTRIAEMVSEVGRLANSPAIARIDPNGDLARLVAAYAQKKQYDDTHTARTADDRAQRDAVNTSYQEFVARVLGRSPYLIPLYQGIFDRVE